MNQLTRNKNFHDLKTNFHFWSDERFFHLDSSKPEDKELLDVILNVNIVVIKKVKSYRSIFYHFF